MADERIDKSWIDNAAAWTDAVREGKIASRKAGTDAAVIRAITERQPHRVLDAGCGEGWLARQLVDLGISVTGFDGSEPLIKRAAEWGDAQFIHLSYTDFIADPSRAGADYDVVTFNFALFTADIVPTLRAAATVLRRDGSLIIQTVHPFNDAEGERYEDGWREETFAKMGKKFKTPMPWYFRTMQSWINSVVQAGLKIAEVREPFDEASGKPLSLLIIARK